MEDCDYLELIISNKSTVSVIAIITFLLNLYCTITLFRRARGRRPSTEFQFGHEPVAGDENGSTLFCSICLCDVAAGEWCRRLPECGHRFHAECVGEWLRREVATCPLCRCRVACEGGELNGSSTAGGLLSLPGRYFWALHNPLDFEISMEFCASFEI